MAEAITQSTKDAMQDYQTRKAFGSNYTFPNPRIVPPSPGNEGGPQVPSEPQKQFDKELPN